ncbi:hypothetical protein [Geobacter sp. SVR]|uniref:hypothetical protein n=1 Tax=Geobacter sp. SVR TaxID=2495594 RepID=UPI00143EFEC7|nr:hypothetical protein [Geobacter sp. SVR]BCS54107.1 hypothetical protein GSVR_24150 [Geobacter sp. SVR]GCF87590.1 hypothetical protein GSbR_41900 [Geobacter sp. SVR]
MAATIVTFSMAPSVIEKLEKLKDFLHTKNKSAIVSHLIEKEYKHQLVPREDNTQ